LKNRVDIQVCGKLSDSLSENRKVKYKSLCTSLGLHENKYLIATVKIRKCSCCLPSFQTKSVLVRYAQVSEGSGITGSMPHSD
jgi:hypothetical protein